jgi:hypothetical protein
MAAVRAIRVCTEILAYFEGVRDALSVTEPYI